MIKLEHIYKDFETNNTSNPINHVLKDLNLVIKDGEFVTLIGSNGSGKSTLLNTIAGSFPPTSGSIYFGKEDVTNLSESKRASYIGRVFQDPTLGTIGDISIEENLAIAYKRGERRHLVWAFKKELRDLYIAKLKPLDLGLEGRLNDRMSSLSGGQRQAVTLLMATLKRPEILLLDEHTAALDPATSKKILTLTQSLIEENHLTALMITHNMKDAIKYGNRLIMLSNGKVIADIAGKKKESLTTDELYAKFEKAESKEKDDSLS
jgi:putative ABC transport system ATP-binding protein